MADRTLPSGTLTFLFTDLEGSTRLLHELGDAYGALLEMHRTLIRNAVVANGGVEFGTGGDALFVVFASPTNALAAAGDAQRALGGHAWSDDVSVRVRMGIHTGEAQIVDGDYVGVALHVAARLCAAGHGGQVLISEATYALARTAPVRSLGVHRLRDVPEQLEIFQLCEPGLALEFPPLKTVDTISTNLPAATDVLVGRELEVVEIAGALTQRRLVTLTGAGGSGKTRLALEVASAVVADYRDGVWLIGLGPATTADQVAALTAEVLRVRDREGEPLVRTVATQLGMQEVLLVLDNCEHLVEPTKELVRTVLQGCPNVRVLVTSREVLDERGEQAISVAPLATPDAVDLFIERARAAVPGFEDLREDRATIEQICRRLDGLPLAIELAAARMRAMSPRQIASRLDDRFRLLGSTRERTLEAVVAWSYDLLDPEEQAAFRRLAIFTGTFDLMGAEVVAASVADAPADIAGILTRLVDKSLVVAVRNADEYRYRMLETLREYGCAQQREANERDDCEAALLTWAQVWTNRLEADMRTTRQDTTLAAAAPERENLRAAYERARAEQQHEIALRIVTFAPIMLLRDRERAIDQLMSMLPDCPATLRGHAFTSKAQFAFPTGRPHDGLSAARAAAEVFDGLHDRRLAAWARYFEIFSAWGLLADSDVLELVDGVLCEFREMHEPLGLAYLLWVQSQLDEDIAVAEAHAAESEAMFREIDAPLGLAHCLEGCALVSLRAGDPGRAASYLAEVLPLMADSLEHGCLAHSLEAAAAVFISQGEMREAAALLAAADGLRTRTGHAHRPWELRSRELAEEALRPEDLAHGQEMASRIDVDALVDQTLQALSHSSATAAPDAVGNDVARPSLS